MIPSKKKKVHQRVHHYTLSTTWKTYHYPKNLQAEKEDPQPQVVDAFGLRITN